MKIFSGMDAEGRLVRKGFRGELKRIGAERSRGHLREDEGITGPSGRSCGAAPYLNEKDLFSEAEVLYGRQVSSMDVREKSLTIFLRKS